MPTNQKKPGGHHLDVSSCSQYSMVGTGWWVPGTGCRVPGSGYRVLGTGTHTTPYLGFMRAPLVSGTHYGPGWDPIIDPIIEPFLDPLETRLGQNKGNRAKQVQIGSQIGSQTVFLGSQTVDFVVFRFYCIL